MDSQLLKEIARKTFPNYKGRKPMRIIKTATYSVGDYWSEGSRDYCMAFNLNTMTAISVLQLKGYKQQVMGNPYHQNIGEVEMEPGVVIVESPIFCGKQMALRLFVHADDANKFEITGW